MASEGLGAEPEGGGRTLRHTYATCVCLWFRSWDKCCEGCLVSSLSPNLPDHHNRPD
jgi:hypothetical protein